MACHRVRGGVLGEGNTRGLVGLCLFGVSVGSMPNYPNILTAYSHFSYFLSFYLFAPSLSLALFHPNFVNSIMSINYHNVEKKKYKWYNLFLKTHVFIYIVFQFLREANKKYENQGKTNNK